MIAIIKYNAGNSRSVKNALTRMGYESLITNDITKIKQADKVIFPGVGEASSAMKYLKQTGLDECILNLSQPFLGICLGMQLMCRSSEEGQTTGLGIFNAGVRRFPSKKVVPHVGWNNFQGLRGDLFKNISVKDDMYYVHSYYVESCLATMATCNYILPFSAALQRDNFYGVQFHPEKSSEAGERVLSNFLKMK